MLSILYPLSFFVSLLGLILWFYYQGNPRMSRSMSSTFLLGFFVYLFSLAFSDGELSDKFLILCRDMVVLALVSQFFNFFRKNKIVFFTMLAVLYGLVHFKLFKFWQQSLPQAAVEQTDFDLSQADPEGELLIELKEGHQLDELEAISSTYGLSWQAAFSPARPGTTELDDYYLVNIPKAALAEANQIKAALSSSELVDWMEINEQIQLDPSEAAISRKAPGRRAYGINDPGISQLWGFDEMQIDQLYELLKNSKSKAAKKARIFILDTGVDGKHEDLRANYRSLKNKYDNDPIGHGTHCAGIAAAVSNNGLGIASFSVDNQYVEVSSVKVLNSFGGGTQTTIIKGIIEAADNGADVISMSLGGFSSDKRQRAYKKAVEYAKQQGAIVLAAAGNSNQNAIGYSPANTPGIITVAAVDTQLNRASFSNFVNDLEMGISAPGVHIYSTIPNNKYTSFNGTSMATPYVAGLVGLMKSLRPQLTAEEVYKILEKSGKATGNTAETGKFIQPAAAIRFLLKQ